MVIIPIMLLVFVSELFEKKFSQRRDHSDHFSSISGGPRRHAEKFYHHTTFVIHVAGKVLSHKTATKILSGNSTKQQVAAYAGTLPHVPRAKKNSFDSGQSFFDDITSSSQRSSCDSIANKSSADGVSSVATEVVHEANDKPEIEYHTTPLRPLQHHTQKCGQPSVVSQGDDHQAGSYNHDRHDTLGHPPDVSPEYYLKTAKSHHLPNVQNALRRRDSHVLRSKCSSQTPAAERSRGSCPVPSATIGHRQNPMPSCPLIPGGNVVNSVHGTCSGRSSSYSHSPIMFRKRHSGPAKIHSLKHLLRQNGGRNSDDEEGDDVDISSEGGHHTRDSVSSSRRSSDQSERSTAVHRLLDDALQSWDNFASRSCDNGRYALQGVGIAAEEEETLLEEVTKRNTPTGEKSSANTMMEKRAAKPMTVDSGVSVAQRRKMMMKMCNVTARQKTEEAKLDLELLVQDDDMIQSSDKKMILPLDPNVTSIMSNIVLKHDTNQAGAGPSAQARLLPKLRQGKLDKKIAHDTVVCDRDIDDTFVGSKLCGLKNFLAESELGQRVSDGSTGVGGSTRVPTPTLELKGFSRNSRTDSAASSSASTSSIHSAFVEGSMEKETDRLTSKNLHTSSDRGDHDDDPTDILLEQLGPDSIPDESFEQFGDSVRKISVQMHEQRRGSVTPSRIPIAGCPKFDSRWSEVAVDSHVTSGVADSLKKRINDSPAMQAILKSSGNAYQDAGLRKEKLDAIRSDNLGDNEFADEVLQQSSRRHSHREFCSDLAAPPQLVTDTKSIHVDDRAAHSVTPPPRRLALRPLPVINDIDTQRKQSGDCQSYVASNISKDKMQELQRQFTEAFSVKPTESSAKHSDEKTRFGQQRFHQQPQPQGKNLKETSDSNIEGPWWPLNCHRPDASPSETTPQQHDARSSQVESAEAAVSAIRSSFGLEKAQNHAQQFGEKQPSVTREEEHFPSLPRNTLVTGYYIDSDHYNVVTPAEHDHKISGLSSPWAQQQAHQRGLNSTQRAATCAASSVAVWDNAAATCERPKTVDTATCGTTRRTRTPPASTSRTANIDASAQLLLSPRRSSSHGPARMILASNKLSVQHFDGKRLVPHQSPGLRKPAVSMDHKGTAHVESFFTPSFNKLWQPDKYLLDACRKDDIKQLKIQRAQNKPSRTTFDLTKTLLSRYSSVPYELQFSRTDLVDFVVQHLDILRRRSHFSEKIQIERVPIYGRPTSYVVTPNDSRPTTAGSDIDSLRPTTASSYSSVCSFKFLKRLERNRKQVEINERLWDLENEIRKMREKWPKNDEAGEQESHYAREKRAEYIEKVAELTKEKDRLAAKSKRARKRRRKKKKKKSKKHIHTTDTTDVAAVDGLDGTNKSLSEASSLKRSSSSDSLSSSLSIGSESVSSATSSTSMISRLSHSSLERHNQLQKAQEAVDGNDAANKSLGPSLREEQSETRKRPRNRRRKSSNDGGESEHSGSNSEAGGSDAGKGSQSNAGSSSAATSDLTSDDFDDNSHSAAVNSLFNAVNTDKLKDLVAALEAGDQDVDCGNGEKINIQTDCEWTVINCSLLLSNLEELNREKGVENLSAAELEREQELRDQLENLQDALLANVENKKLLEEQKEREAKQKLLRGQALQDLFKGLAGDVYDEGIWERTRRRQSGEIIGIDDDKRKLTNDCDASGNGSATTSGTLCKSKYRPPAQRKSANTILAGFKCFTSSSSESNTVKEDNDDHAADLDPSSEIEKKHAFRRSSIVLKGNKKQELQEQLLANMDPRKRLLVQKKTKTKLDEMRKRGLFIDFGTRKSVNSVSHVPDDTSGSVVNAIDNSSTATVLPDTANPSVITVPDPVVTAAAAAAVVSGDSAIIVNSSTTNGSAAPDTISTAASTPAANLLVDKALTDDTDEITAIMDEEFQEREFEKMRENYKKIVSGIKISEPKTTRELKTFLELHFPAGLDIVSDFEQRERKRLAAVKEKDSTIPSAPSIRRSSTTQARNLTSLSEPFTNTNVRPGSSGAVHAATTGATVVVVADESQTTEEHEKQLENQAIEAAFVNCRRRFQGVYTRIKQMQVFHKHLQNEGINPEMIRALDIVKWNNNEVVGDGGSVSLDRHLNSIGTRIAIVGESAAAKEEKLKEDRKMHLRKIIKGVILQVEKESEERKQRKKASGVAKVSSQEIKRGSLTL